MCWRGTLIPAPVVGAPNSTPKPFAQWYVSRHFVT